MGQVWSLLGVGLARRLEVSTLQRDNISRGDDTPITTSKRPTAMLRTPFHLPSGRTLREFPARATLGLSNVHSANRNQTR